MSQSSLSEAIQDAGLTVKKGVKISTREDLEGRNMDGSNLWLYRWAANSHKNYQIVSRGKGVRMLADSAKGLPAIIVGVGPSLDKSIGAIKAAVGRAIIISTDAAFRALMANGITPDIVFSFDCKPEQRFLWEHVPAHNVPILLDSCAHPDTIASWKGPILFYNHWHQTDELSRIILPHVYPLIGQVPSGGTVGNSALLLSQILGCSPAIAVGMDFCYEADGDAWRYRASDYRYERLTNLQGSEIAGQWKLTEIKQLYDNDQRFARSTIKNFMGVDYRMDPELEYYHETFLKFVSHFKIQTINASPAGALKDAVMTMTAEEAILRFCPPAQPHVPFFELIKQIGPDPRVAA